MVGSTPSHYENFAVASVLLPRRLRRDIAALYAFARTADDFADEGVVAGHTRLARLDAWQARLHRAAAGAQQPAAASGEPADAPALFGQIGRTIRDHSLPVELFDALLSAFRQDVTVHRYQHWGELLDYCSRSAIPVGRLVLRIAGYRDPRLDGWSDAICTALQLTNFWQDLGQDYLRGRLYVPVQEMLSAGVAPHDLEADRLSAAWRSLMVTLIARTRALFDEGRPVCDAVSGRLGLELRATWLGGTRILDRIEDAGCDVLAVRPVIGGRDLPWLIARMVAWRLHRHVPPTSLARPERR
jgi:squalene synthase HpnC